MIMGVGLMVMFSSRVPFTWLYKTGHFVLVQVFGPLIFAVLTIQSVYFRGTNAGGRETSKMMMGVGSMVSFSSRVPFTWL